MDKSDPPTTFGVFKPVGHTVIAYRSLADTQTALAALAAQGVAASDLVRYSPQEMIALVDAELQAASPLAAFGYELDQIKANRVLAQDGCNFLVVKAEDDEQAKRFAELAETTHAVAAQHYGRFLIEELLERQHSA